jgi:hypothetical protein
MENHEKMRPGAWYAVNTPLFRSICAALAALLVYGSWAAWANRMHGAEMMMRASATQGFFSAVVTLTMTAFLEALYTGAAPRMQRLIRSVVSTIALLVVLSTGIHWLVGTEEILITVLPGWIFGSLYAVVYALGLSRAEAAGMI